MKEPIDTKDKSMLDKVIILVEYIKTIYICKMVIELLKSIQ